MKTLFILEDHPTTAIVTEEIFKSVIGSVQVKYFESLRDLASVNVAEADILVSDLALPDSTPSEVLDFTLSRFEKIPRIYFTSLLDADLNQRVVESGGLFLTKNTKYKSLIESVQKYLRMGAIDVAYADSLNSYQSYIQFPGTSKPLTLKQAKVMEQISRGLTGKEVARRLGMSPDTVSAHVKEAFHRLGVQNRVEAVARFNEAKKIASRLHGDVVIQQISSE
ncbi:MAG TPA: LuxR C-terminal-related transcriptional regulator [Limnobacter sp.]|nr:LuxR C-terminal-related transcriptional regulator [Limnobacter sp.]